MRRKVRHSLFLSTIILIHLCSFRQAQSSDIVACKIDSTGKCRYGLYSEKGEIVLPFEYTMIWKHTWGLWIVGTGNGTLVLDANVRPFISDTVERVMQIWDEGNRLPVQSGGKWGFYNNAGELVIKYQFDEVSEFYNGYAKCVLKGKTIAIDTNGAKVSMRNVRDPDHYFIGDIMEMSDIPSFNDDSLTVRKENGLFGLADRKNVWKIPPIYQAIGENMDGRILAKKNDRWGVIDYDGNVIVPFVHESLYFQ